MQDLNQAEDSGMGRIWTRRMLQPWGIIVIIAPVFYIVPFPRDLCIPIIDTTTAIPVIVDRWDKDGPLHRDVLQDCYGCA